MPNAEIKVLSSIATREAYNALVPQFEKASGRKVATTWAGTTDIMKRMAAGERHDLVMISSDEMEALIRQGRIVAGSRVDIARSGIGICVRAGSLRPRIDSAEALKRALLAAQTVGYTSGPSGVYMAQLIERLGISEQIGPKHRTVPSGGTIGTLVARGEAEIGFQQISELVHIEGIDYIGPLPAEVQKITVFSSGIHAAAENPDGAKELVRFLTAPAAQPAYKAAGLELP